MLGREWENANVIHQIDVKMWIYIYKSRTYFFPNWNRKYGPRLRFSFPFAFTNNVNEYN